MKSPNEIEQLLLWKRWIVLIKLGFILIFLLSIYVIAQDLFIETSIIVPKGLDTIEINAEIEIVDSDPEVMNGVHLETGLAYGSGFSVVRSTCLACHSAKLITQNRATREGWEEMIRWMQSTQGLPPLGDKESLILDYLAKNYAPEHSGRRKSLDTSDLAWYVLDLN